MFCLYRKIAFAVGLTCVAATVTADAGEKPGYKGSGRGLGGVIPASGDAFTTTLSALTDGVDESIDSANFATGITTQGTVMLWVKSVDATWSTMGWFIKGNLGSSTLSYRLLSVGTSQLQFLISSDGSSYTTPRISLSAIGTQEWHQIVITFDEDDSPEVVFYVAGESDDAFSTPSVTDPNVPTTVYDSASTNFRVSSIVSTYGDFYFSDVAVWDTSLTAAEVDDLRVNRQPIDLSGHARAADLVFWIRNGSGTGDAHPTIVDQSGNGRNFTMTNMEAGDLVADVPPAP